MYKVCISLVTALPFVLIHSTGYAADCEGTSGVCNIAEHMAEEPVLHAEVGQLIQDYLLEHREVIGAVLKAHPELVLDALATGGVPSDKKHEHHAGSGAVMPQGGRDKAPGKQ